MFEYSVDGVPVDTAHDYLIGNEPVKIRGKPPFAPSNPVIKDDEYVLTEAIELFGATRVPKRTLKSSHWREWCDFYATIADDDDFDFDAEGDLPILVETWRALLRRGVVFRKSINRAMEGVIEAGYGSLEADDWDADINQDDG